MDLESVTLDDNDKYGNKHCLAQRHRLTNHRHLPMLIACAVCFVILAQWDAILFPVTTMVVFVLFFIVPNGMCLMSATPVQPRKGGEQGRCHVQIALVLLFIIICVSPDILIRLGTWNNKWIYAFEPLEPGHRPAFCNITETIDSLLTKAYLFGPETPHWDGGRDQCDCTLPDYGAEDGRCVTTPNVSATPTFTVVTALVDLGKRARSGCAYLHMMQSQLVRHYNLVIYTEPWAVEFVTNYRMKLGLANRTKVYQLTRSSQMAFYHLLPEMRRITRRNWFMHFLTGWQSGVAQKSISQYGWMTHQKIDFMLQTAYENPFGTDYFVWIDAGAGHGHVAVPYHFCGCNLAVPGTVTLYLNNLDEETLFTEGKCKNQITDGSTTISKLFHMVWPHVGCEPLRDITLHRYTASFWKYHHFDEVMGTFFGGSREGLQKLFVDYNRTVHSLLQAGHVDTEQGIFAIIASGRPSYIRWVSSNFHGTRYIC